MVGKKHEKKFLLLSNPENLRTKINNYLPILQEALKPLPIPLYRKLTNVTTIIFEDDLKVNPDGEFKPQ